MSLLLAMLALPICLVIALRRRREPRSFWAPVAVAAIAIVSVISTVVEAAPWFGNFAAMKNPEDKATVIAAGISEALRTSTVHALFAVLAMVAVWLIDRFVRRQKTQRASATPAPESLTDQRP